VESLEVADENRAVQTTTAALQVMSNNSDNSKTDLEDEDEDESEGRVSEHNTISTLQLIRALQVTEPRRLPCFNQINPLKV
jgi:hypothetical protein